LLILAIAMMGLACANNGERTAGAKAPDPQAEQIASEPVQLDFLDSRIFDEDLSASMSGESPTVTVNVAVGFNLNDIPERFDSWFYSVKQSGGTVVAKPENPSRGLVSAVIDVVVAIAEKIDEMRLYQPSEQYNATLLYREDGTVSKVVFDRR
jgi:hypothetical protein